MLSSAAASVIRQASETLSGRVAYLELNPLSLTEVLLTSDPALAQERLQQFIRTFAERELGSLGQDVTEGLINKTLMIKDLSC